MKVFWTVLFERSIGQYAVSALLDVAGVAAHCKALRINQMYQRVDMARNNAVKVFMKNTTDADDVLVMLDADHTHPRDIIPRLISRVDSTHEVVGALAFRRSLPHDPCCYRFGEGGAVDIPTSFSGGLEQCDIVGTGAIAIRRSTFPKLDAAGLGWPYFRFTYQDGMENEIQRSEDWQFGLNCKAAGIPHWVDTSLVTPHITDKAVTQDDWFQTLQEASEDPEGTARKYDKLGMTFNR